jgi:hypothetical protein
VREARIERANSYESGYLFYMTPCFHVILSPPPLTGLGYSRRDIRSTGTHPLNGQVTEVLLNSLAICRRMVGRAGFEPATFDSNECITRLDSRCKRDIIAGLD